MRRHQLMEFFTDAVVIRRPRPQSTQDMERSFGCLWVFLQHESRALGVPERYSDKSQTNRDLDNVGDAPGNVVGRLVERHSVARPESNETSQLIAELGDCTDEATSQLCGGAFGDVEVCCDIDTSKAKSTGESCQCLVDNEMHGWRAYVRSRPRIKTPKLFGTTSTTLDPN